MNFEEATIDVTDQYVEIPGCQCRLIITSSGRLEPGDIIYIKGSSANGYVKEIQIPVISLRSWANYDQTILIIHCIIFFDKLEMKIITATKQTSTVLFTKALKFKS